MQRKTFELEILKRLQDSNPAHPRYRYTPRLLDSFEHVGPNGRHVCLVFEPLVESFASFGTLFLKCQALNPLMQHFAKQILLALDYARECHIIHTGKRPDRWFGVEY